MATASSPAVAKGNGPGVSRSGAVRMCRRIGSRPRRASDGQALSDTEELRSEQERRASEEARRAREAESEEETKSHARRAEKSEYLREKLEERAESERDEQ